MILPILQTNKLKIREALAQAHTQHHKVAEPGFKGGSVTVQNQALNHFLIFDISLDRPRISSRVLRDE